MAPITLGSNTTSLVVQRELGQASSSLAKSYQRLSSGLRINEASDDAAGLAIATQLNSKARVYTQAIRNVNDGVSVATIAEGALTALKSISERQLELSTEAANGTYSLTQRQALNTEANKLVDEYNRIVQSTTFNGLNLFDPSLGTVVIQAGYGQAGSLQLGLDNQLARPVGDGTFGTGHTVGINHYSPAAADYSVAAADFNGDGISDLLIDTQFGMRVELGNGHGTFAQPIDANVTDITGATAYASGDFNGDGKIDEVVVDNTDSVAAVLLGSGNGRFKSETVLPTAGGPTSVATGDFNGDGKLDFATNNSDGTINVFLGNGNGTFQASISLAAGGERIATGDFNGDGKTDIVSDSGQVFLSNGNDTFQTGQNFSGGGNGVVVADFNDDGILDAATVNFNGGVQVNLGNANGTFQATKTFIASIQLNSIQIGDFNGDGATDLFVGSYSGEDSLVLFGNNDGTFKAPITNSATGKVAIGDFNGDSRSDFAEAYGTAKVTISFGNGGYTATTPYLDINTQQGARDALNSVNINLGRIEAQLGVIGATTSRFQVALNTLQTEDENFQAAASQIQDVDVASETANLTREQILQQAAASVLAQANQEPSLALKLLG